MLGVRYLSGALELEMALCYGAGERSGGPFIEAAVQGMMPYLVGGPTSCGGKEA